MNFAISTINQSLELLQNTVIPERAKIVITYNLSAAKEILKHDPFHGIRCEFFIKEQLENLVQNLKNLHKGYEEDDKILNVVADSCTVLLFLGVTNPDNSQ